MGSMKYSFIAIIPESRIPFRDQIDLFKNDLYLIGPFAKKKKKENLLKKQLHKNINIDI